MTRLIDELEAQPLLGSGLAAARELDARLSHALTESPDDLASLRLLIRRGERQLVAMEEGAAETLAEAARWAMALGEPRLELRCRLLTARALADAGSLADARALLRRAEIESADAPELAPDRALARSAAGLQGVVGELRQAWDQLEHDAAGQPGLRARRAHERLAMAVQLAEALAGSEWTESERWSLRAQGLAREHGEERLARRLELQQGALLLRHGRSTDAIAPLERAFDADDPLVRLASGLLLAGLYLDRQQLDRADAVALMTLTLAEERRNWLAFSSAAIDRARCAELRGEDPELVLREALHRCRALGEPGALLQARILELRAPDRPEDSADDEELE